MYVIIYVIMYARMYVCNKVCMSIHTNSIPVRRHIQINHSWLNLGQSSQAQPQHGDGLLHFFKQSTLFFPLKHCRERFAWNLHKSTLGQEAYWCSKDTHGEQWRQVNNDDRWTMMTVRDDTTDTNSGTWPSMSITALRLVTSIIVADCVNCDTVKV